MTANVALFHRALAASANVVFLAGAGLSAASGIPTFRGAGGLWRNHDAMALATPEAFQADPSKVWQFYHTRRCVAAKAQPNAAHIAIARSCVPSFRSAPWHPHVSLSFITQNVDGLSPRAQAAIKEPSDATYLEIHGSIWNTLCIGCKRRENNTDSPIAPALAGTEFFDSTTGQEPVIPLEQLPHCNSCKTGLLRPGTVWFGEMPRHLDQIGGLLRNCDMLIVVGTSSTVYPAAGFASEVRSYGGKVAVFNLDRSQGDEEADFLFLGPCEETLPLGLGQSAQPTRSV